jgi:two-component system cell cycle sensor histidine kinase/response regulator CckA
MQVETDSKHAEEALRASELRYRRLFETAKDGILILDAKTGQITDVNPFLVKLLGYTYNEFIGVPLWEIGPFRDIKECKLAFLELQDKEYIRYESLPLETKDGRSVAVEFVSNVYGLSGGTRVIQCNIRDITERKRGRRRCERVKSVGLRPCAVLAMR